MTHMLMDKNCGISKHLLETETADYVAETYPVVTREF